MPAPLIILGENGDGNHKSYGEIDSGQAAREMTLWVWLIPQSRGGAPAASDSIRSSRRWRCVNRVLSVPKRLRYFLEREPRAVSAVLHILLRVIEAHLRKTSPRPSPLARLGAVKFVNRFGFSLTSVSARPRFPKSNVRYLESTRE